MAVPVLAVVAAPAQGMKMRPACPSPPRPRPPCPQPIFGGAGQVRFSGPSFEVFGGWFAQYPGTTGPQRAADSCTGPCTLMITSYHGLNQVPASAAGPAAWMCVVGQHCCTCCPAGIAVAPVQLAPLRGCVQNAQGHRATLVALAAALQALHLNPSTCGTCYCPALQALYLNPNADGVPQPWGPRRPPPFHLSPPSCMCSQPA